MIDRLLSYVAPHPCCGCGKTGTLLCDNCKYNIINDIVRNCIVCENPASMSGVCSACRTSYSRGWCVGERSGELQKLIDLYKFEHARGAYRPLADLLLAYIDHLPPETIVVPIPTIAPHIRQRGYDHTQLIARFFAKKRGLRVSSVLRRASATRQRGANRSLREAQAKQAFKVSHALDEHSPYLLIDDVITTGSTLRYAAYAMQAAGASDVWVAAIARQPLD